MKRILAIAALCLAGLIRHGAADGKVLHLDGTSEGLTAKHCKALDLEDGVTLEAWIRPRPMGRQGGRILDKGTAGTKSRYYVLTVGRRDSIITDRRRIKVISVGWWK